MTKLLQCGKVFVQLLQQEDFSPVKWVFEDVQEVRQVLQHMQPWVWCENSTQI
jgi:hypothetical protein